MARPQQKKTNWFAIWTTVAAVVVAAAITVAVVLGNLAAGGTGTQPQAANVNAETGAITYGTGENTVDTFVDFMCPACGSFEDTYGATLQAAAADDTITLNIHPVAILNHMSQGTKYSTRSGNAMYCVAEEAPDVALDFFNAMFENQPDENTTGLSEEQIIAIAEQTGANAATSCITDGTFNRFVEYQTKERDIRSTPTIEVNGTRLDSSQIAAELAGVLGGDTATDNG